MLIYCQSEGSGELNVSSSLDVPARLRRQPQQEKVAQTWKAAGSVSKFCILPCRLQGDNPGRQKEAGMGTHSATLTGEAGQTRYREKNILPCEVFNLALKMDVQNNKTLFTEICAHS